MPFATTTIITTITMTILLPMILITTMTECSSFNHYAEKLVNRYKSVFMNVKRSFTALGMHKISMKKLGCLEQGSFLKADGKDGLFRRRLRITFRTESKSELDRQLKTY